MPLHSTHPHRRHPLRFVAGLLALLGATIAPAADLAPRIIGGNDAGNGEYPFVAAILDAGDTSSDFNAFFCGGTVIAPSWVMTAAHCMAGQAPSNIAVLPGLLTLNMVGTNTRTGIDAIITHPDFDASTLAGDVALLHLTTPAANFVALDDGTLLTSLPAAADLVALGWGAVTNDDPDTPLVNEQTYPLTLQDVVLDYISFSDCNGAAYYAGDLTDDTYCAGVVDSGGVKDTCFGDSGGPLLRDIGGGAWRQVGITSSGDATTCADPLHPGVYVHVGQYKAWIDDVQSLADLHVTNTVLATVANRSTLRITVTNQSPVTVATNVQLVLSFDGKGSSTNADALENCSGSGPVTCSLGTLAPLGSTQGEFELAFGGGVTMVTAVATTSAGDYDPSDDSSSRRYNTTRKSSGDGGGAFPGLSLLLLLGGLAGRRRRPAAAPPGGGNS